MTARWLELLRTRVARDGCAAVGRAIGYSRTAVSLANAGKYPGGTEKLASAVMDRLGAVLCPHQGREIPMKTCRGLRSAPMPTANRSAYRQWQACRTRPHNPERDDVTA